MKNRWKIICFVLLLVLCTASLAVISVNSKNLRIIACDVGQGDAFLITYKSSQILIDGGPNKKVTECVSKNIPFWDRTLEIVILTHPQADHFLGLIEIFKNYNVNTFLVNNLNNSTPEYKLLISEVVTSGARVVFPNNVSSINVGLIHLDIVFPSSEYFRANTTKSTVKNVAINLSGTVLGEYTTTLDTNDFSISLLLNFGNFRAIFTGDLSQEGSKKVAQILRNRGAGPINYIKLPHHGSRNGLTSDLLEVVKPQVAVISVGKNNSYGHPHDETLQMLSDKDIKILRTDQDGDAIVETDGVRTWIRNWFKYPI